MSETGTARKPIVATLRGKPNGRTRRYRLERELGSGSGAQVYLATALPDDGSADDTRPVALKISTVPKWKGWLAKEAELLREITRGTAEKAASAGTPIPDRIVKLTGDGALLETPGRNGPDWLFELEYLDGQTLAEWIRTDWSAQPRSATERLAMVVRTGTELAEALDQLARATAQPVVHRDLKPDNIMRTSRGLRVFDFNVGGALDEIRRTRVGTQGYMAPEIEAGEEQDQRADFYSVGVILFELFVGRRFEAWKDRPGPPMACRFAVPDDWPSGLPKQVDDRLQGLLGRLVCCASERLGSARSLVHELEAIEGEHTTAASLRLEPLKQLDMIELLFELRPSGMASVVTDTAGRGGGSELQAELRRRMQVEDPLEDWLTTTIETLARSGGAEPRLVLLAGNAGDGKSHLIERLLQTLRTDRPDLLDRLVYIADATHSHSPDKDQRGRLREFFAPFADGAEADDRVRLIAMNTGMVINFFEKEASLEGLYRTLQWQLGLFRGPEPGGAGRVEAVNLDLRNMLVAGPGGTSFLGRMIDRLDPAREDSIAAGHWSDCEQCPAFGLCPVAFNLQALQRSTPRRGLVGLLQRVSLDAEVHLSPRSLWGFLYRVVTGGTERYVDGRRDSETPCDYVRRQANDVDGGAWLLAGQFTQSLFGQERGGALFDGLIEHDPAYSACPEIDRLHTRLSVRSELDCEPEYVEEQLGGRMGRLEGLQLADLASRLPREPALRRNAAVRREFFFSQTTFEAWARTEGSESFVRLLRAYASWSHGTKPTREDKAALQGLGSRIRAVFQRAHGRRFGGRPFLRVSQPNVRTDTELLVQATDDGLREMFSLSRILLKEPHIVAHAGRKDLLARLGHQPVTVLLRIAGVQLIIDLELYDFLSRVEEGQKPAQRDLAQFQALLFVGERVGNQLATSGDGRPARLFVYGPEDESLHELQTNDFGDVEMTRSSLLDGGAW